MLTEAGRRLEHRGQSADLRIGELEHLPLKDGETEVAIINMVLHHLREPLQGLLEAHRILDQGGTLILADFAKHEQESLRSRYGDHWLGFTEQEFESWLGQAGFDMFEKQCFSVRRALRVFVYTCRKTENRPHGYRRKNHQKGAEA
jgi:ArsR family transcriptional regulator